MEINAHELPECYVKSSKKLRLKSRKDDNFFRVLDKLFIIRESFIEERKRQGLSQRDLAKLCGVKQPMIARIESADSIPQLDTLLRIAVALDIDLKIEKGFKPEATYQESDEKKGSKSKNNSLSLQTK